ncbi:MAG: xanthine dehydrogenase accessory protein XdhC [Phreatobacter sp.]|uniref:xanthine dehydrogenase accessory protein XdhC n=1 Tax=Phreatobacter sp. TaxID=1966341 RepID=UPI001A5D0598|nr:xanthine dehydrogenase accessory protein XdhC [Phreatobacter sp.]MBL8569610.1 xanthine dehydrogenase accessory protein XdhC [Phreatobacter sp.]
MEVWPRIEAMIEAYGACALVSVLATQGSVPREAGARMIVRPDGAFSGSIGGGTLEWQVLARAQAMLARGERAARLVDQSLGPDLGQCCGGRVTLAIEVFDRTDVAQVSLLATAERSGPLAVEATLVADRYERRIVGADASVDRPGTAHFVEHFSEHAAAILLFGAGHVGRALVMALAPLPFRVVWNDERENAFPAALPVNVEATRAPWSDILAHAPAGSQVLVMTHSHALDLEIVAAALSSARVVHVGLIGSATKRARFARRLAERGLPAGRIGDLRCPIGIGGIRGKEPAVIAASVAAECLALREARSIGQNRPEARRRA